MKIRLKRPVGRPKGRKPHEETDFLKLPALSKYTGLSRAMIITLRKQGLPCLKIGGNYYFHRETVIAWINENMRI